MKRQTREMAAALAVCGLLATACGNSEAPSNKARANAPLKPAQGTLDGTSSNASADEATKERLARQEAATKLFDKSKAEPAPARAEAAKPAAPAPAPESVKTAAAAPAKAEPAKSAPAPAPEPVQRPVIPAEAGTQPTKGPEPVAPPKVEVAAAKAPAAQPPPPPALAAAKLVSRVEPDYPREAVIAGAERGSVKARMTLDGNGNVTRVEVVEANPRRLFDRAVVRALSQWHFNEGPSGRTVETEVEFRLK
ncbi:hypothetical protein DSM104443_03477 [Usitatibacter rugosus]|uniref:Protein TonB n=1 Tax=Usitatibacter rugosus TaxID=2732067 RepID=A0A6M4GYP6_9PROT|nr:energy transducer TonB [Usitatibacter rugosus]QJR12391.1 hypothetical protein DSM104443_03477 [Usitatibacter rugosus]